MDYFVTNRTTISAGIVRVHGEFNPKDVLVSDSSLDGGSYLSYSDRRTNNHREFNAVGGTGGFK